MATSIFSDPQAQQRETRINEHLESCAEDLRGLIHVSGQFQKELETHALIASHMSQVSQDFYSNINQILIDWHQRQLGLDSQISQLTEQVQNLTSTVQELAATNGQLISQLISALHPPTVPTVARRAAKGE
ncbi:hypothetical protein [Trichormus variabilis]|uniref:Uncharacterized protein n=1 Tax=Trichormus variabilis NIES-23 TaxID=1973479 RepID=A0A1Z4KX23_ANAVA|nr:hypothetical protein [Trichormus variabilis]MBD2352845.1 hypothetical protein [Trichormus variabilis FACHB-171]BAY73590.1 hypothetical protein NIES23_64420 [Trichormus variabilis NIES-23]